MHCDAIVFCPNRVELIAELLKSPDLYVMQVEMDVYTLAKRVC